MIERETTKPPTEYDRWMSLPPERREALVKVSKLSVEEIDALVAIVHDRMFWSRLRKKVAGLGGVIIAITGIIIGITAALRAIEGWFK